MYVCIKSDLSICEYLNTMEEINLRRAYTRFRIGMSPLRSRHLQFKTGSMVNRLCRFCKNCNETEVHFLFVCPEYSQIRNDFIPPKYYRRPSKFRMCMLLRSSDNIRNRKTAIFICKALRVRQLLLGNQYVLYVYFSRN